jgi:hypothetical protein
MLSNNYETNLNSFFMLKHNEYPSYIKWLEFFYFGFSYLVLKHASLFFFLNLMAMRMLWCFMNSWAGYGTDLGIGYLLSFII